MTIKELINELELQVTMGRGDYTVKIWTDYRRPVDNTLRDDVEREFYLCNDD